MKKLFSKLFIVGALGAFMISCGDDDDDATPPVLSVEVVSLGADDEYTDDETVALTVGFVAEAQLAGASYSVEDADGNSAGTGVIDFSTVGLGSEEVTGTFDFNLGLNESLAGLQLTITFTVEDKQGVTASDSYTFDVIASAEPIQNFTTVLLGAQGNSSEGFYDAFTGTKYGYAAARDASTVTESPIDFAYYWGATNNSTIAAIDDAGLNSVYTAVSLPIEGIFGTRNATRFNSVSLTEAEFDAIDNEDDLISAASFDSPIGTSNVTGLAEGDVFAFALTEDRGGYFGLIKVVSVDDTNGNGTITIEVKVEAGS